MSARKDKFKGPKEQFVSAAQRRAMGPNDVLEILFFGVSEKFDEFQSLGSAHASCKKMASALLQLNCIALEFFSLRNHRN